MWPWPPQMPSSHQRSGRCHASFNSPSDLMLLLGLTAGAVIYQTLGSYYDARRFPAPGRMIDIGSCRLHVKELGAGSPAVVQ